MTDLNDFLPPNSGWTLYEATAINDAGQLVGYGTVNGRGFRAFLLTLDGGDHPGVVAFPSSTGLEMSQVAGALADARGTSAVSVSGALVGIGQTGQARPGPGPMTEVTSAVSSGINDRGQVVGSSLTTANEAHAFLWDHRHGLQDLDIPVANPGPTAINDSDQVVGGFGSLVHAFLWEAQGGVQNLGTLHQGTERFAEGINEAGQVVGWSNLGGGFKTRHAFLRKRTGPIGPEPRAGDGPPGPPGGQHRAQAAGRVRRPPWWIR
jgi:probable HAF family extracellular repeat protein